MLRSEDALQALVYKTLIPYCKRQIVRLPFNFDHSIPDNHNFSILG